MTLTSVGTFAVTGTFKQYNKAPARGWAQLTGIPGQINGPTGALIVLGPQRVPLDRLGRFIIRLPTDATSGDSTALQYRLTVTFRGSMPDFTRTFYAKAAGTVTDVTTPSIAVVIPGGNGSTLPATIPFLLGSSGFPTDVTPTTSGSVLPQTIPFIIGDLVSSPKLRVAVDTDGAYYYAIDGTLSLLVDTDGTPYVDTTGGPGGSVGIDTDGVPYYLA